MLIAKEAPVKPLAAPVIAKSLLTPEQEAPPRPTREGAKDGPERTRRRRSWLRAPVPPPARFLLGRRPSA
jgi:hypothetical protein